MSRKTLWLIDLTIVAMCFMAVYVLFDIRKPLPTIYAGKSIEFSGGSNLTVGR